ncbi:uncharacterized protein LOC115370791 isoform X2 [Myripristis murdjan]|uniref:uncharacterized protein LOC115370791 isoform X2 n=1 Tax=Myripristis murdjan TaxID=586833 RepID=UPI00117633DD|nr:uncharacterized protein LOC115370791 isoform X2 [Myripristis murdjan]
MHGFLFIAFSCLWILPGVHSKECYQTVLARRYTYYVPEGGSQSLSCVVQHCGEEDWTGEWVWRNSSEVDVSILKPTLRHHLSNETLSANKTHLSLKLMRVNQSDEGYYGCKVTWGNGARDQGHMTYVNITSAVPSERSILIRVLVCVGASLCFPVILGLARCLSSEVKPQSLPMTLPTNQPQPKPRAACRSQPRSGPKPPPRRPRPQKQSSSAATPKSKQPKELVYAALSQDALEQQRATREPPQATVYSSLQFS